MIEVLEDGGYWLRLVRNGGFMEAECGGCGVGKRWIRWVEMVELEGG